MIIYVREKNDDENLSDPLEIIISTIYECPIF